ncbi:MAG: aminoacyl-tRNA hydrolase [Cyclobacteriaceae bacterium]|jgi:PTH1 family peptidyl-tRNA hydrolase|nr:aminoacyl-tRNA hydrolase [Cyclobacteriaceae bacterium]
MKYLIIGLGNPGVEYELTRHNIGFLILDRLADQKKIKFEQGRYGFWTLLKHKGRSIYLLKPSTFINLSGRAVNYWMHYLKVAKPNMMVITDDLALPYGKLRMRQKGSAGGHNGLKNIEELIGGQDYLRLRFGVGDDYRRGRQIDYVLSPFNQKEMEALISDMDCAIDAALTFCTQGIENAMNQFNG